MKLATLFFVVSGAAFAATATASAQESSMQGHDMSSVDLPQACHTAQAPEMPGMAQMKSAMGDMPVHAQEAMKGMMQTHEPMMQGMMAEDPDIAFACGMIPHHQGAINMAEVELQYGDSDEMKQLAQKIIDDQKKEIEQLTQWIEGQSQ